MKVWRHHGLSLTLALLFAGTLCIGQFLTGRRQYNEERQERDDHHQHDVQPQQRRVDGAQAHEQPVMGHPDHADREEARDVREVRRPLGADRAPEMVELLGRELDLEHEQRDRDREHAVVERLDA